MIWSTRFSTRWVTTTVRRWLVTLEFTGLAGFRRKFAVQKQVPH